MKSRILVSLRLFAATAAQAGWRVGNPGGDNVGLLFENARQHASNLVARAQLPALLKVTNAQVAEWIADHKAQLAADIMASPHRRNEEEARTCAQTSFPEVDELNRLPVAKPIELFFPTCRVNVQTFEDAAGILIHESVHHFNIASEEFADQVAVALMTVARLGLLDWLPMPATTAIADHAAVWTGTEMVVFGGTETSTAETNKMRAFNPQTGAWRNIDSRPISARRKAHLFAHGKYLIIWGGLQGNEWVNDGAAYNMETNRWKTFRNTAGLARLPVARDMQAQTAVFTGRDLIVFGGTAHQGIGGAVINLENLESAAAPAVRGIATPDWAVRREGHSAVLAGNSVLIWSGLDAGWNYSAEGVAINLQNLALQPITGLNAPKGTYDHSAVWTGEKMIVFGGYEMSRDMAGRGGIYDPATGRWTEITTDLALARNGHTALWSGKEMLVYGGQLKRSTALFGSVVAFNPETGHWRAVTGPSQPSARYGHTAVLANGQMIVLGGKQGSTEILSDGGAFIP